MFWGLWHTPVCIQGLDLVILHCIIYAVFSEILGSAMLLLCEIGTCKPIINVQPFCLTGLCFP